MLDQSCSPKWIWGLSSAGQCCCTAQKFTCAPWHEGQLQLQTSTNASVRVCWVRMTIECLMQLERVEQLDEEAWAGVAAVDRGEGDQTAWG